MTWIWLIGAIVGLFGALGVRRLQKPKPRPNRDAELEAVRRVDEHETEARVALIDLERQARVEQAEEAHRRRVDGALTREDAERLLRDVEEE